MKRYMFGLIIACALIFDVLSAVPMNSKVKYIPNGPVEPIIDYRIGAVRDAGMKGVENILGNGEIKTLISGTKKFPLVMMKFPDQAGTYNPSDFDALCFDTLNYVYNNLYMYYFLNSSGLLTFTGKSYGWWTTDSNKVCYGYGSANQGALCAWEAAHRADAYGINWAQYDNDNDGYVDAFIVVHSGSGHEETGSSSDIHSHNFRFSYAGYGEFVTSTPWPGHSGQYIKINNYTIQPEKQFGALVKIGVIAHEMGHAFGLPDTYDTSPSNAGAGLGNFCLMAGGSWGAQGNNAGIPTTLSAWCRIQLGWITPQLITTSGYYAFPQNNIHSKAYIVPTPYSSEYFLLENRTLDVYDQELYHAGLFIYHIDTTIIHTYRPYNQINRNSHAYGIALEEADASADDYTIMHLFIGTNRGSAQDMWYTGYYNHFDSIPSLGYPTSKTNGGVITGTAITLISAPADTMWAWIDLRANLVKSAWPGDCDNNGVVNAIDILPLGRFWHATGNPRDDTTTSWTAKTVISWAQDEATYADCDGNGIVDIQDVLAIGRNWHGTHSKTITETVFNLDDPELAKYIKNYQEIYNALSGESDAVREIKQVLLSIIQKYGGSKIFYLSQCRPNPCRTGTAIEFSLSKESRASLKLYNVTGQLVQTLVDAKMNAGVHSCQWNGKDQNGRDVSSGLYFVRLSAGEFTSTKKLTVIR